MIEEIDQGAACSDNILGEASSVTICAYAGIPELDSCKQCICVAGADTCRLQEE